MIKTGFFLFLIIFIFSYSTIDEKENVSKKEDKTEKSEEFFAHNVRVKEEVMLEKGYKKRKEGESFGNNIYDFINNKTVTKDVNIIKWILKVDAFSRVSFYAHNPTFLPTKYFVLLNVRIREDEDFICLTTDPFSLKNSDPKKYYEIEYLEKEGKIVKKEKYIKVPWIDEIIQTDKPTIEKYCLPFNIKSKYLKMNRNQLIREFNDYSRDKFECEWYPEKQSKCKLNNDIKEWADIIYALVEKGFLVALSSHGRPISVYHHSTYNGLWYSWENTEHFLFY